VAGVAGEANLKLATCLDFIDSMIPREEWWKNDQLPWGLFHVLVNKASFSSDFFSLGITTRRDSAAHFFDSSFE
jgi:hypothetical protein